MTRLSRRYVRLLAVCLLLALVPVVVHSYLKVETGDCKAPWAFVPEAGLVSDFSGSRDAWMREFFQSSQWQEGSFSKDGLHFDFSIIRSYDAKRLYHRPETSLVEQSIVDTRGIEWVQADSVSLPIHRAYYGATDRAILVAYLLVYRASPVASPYWAQLRAAPLELFAGRHPMTLFFIQGRGSPSRFPQMERVGREWLLSSWDKYHSACNC